jgi:hypothetical protein
MSTPENGNQIPPVPRYGEYAPPQQQAPQQAPPQVSQQLPPQPPPYHGQQAYYGVQSGKRPLRTADLIISIILLVVGLFGALNGIYGALQLEYLMQIEYTQFGLGTYVQNGPFVAVQAIIIVSHAVLYIITVPVTIALISKRTMAFWVPLSAGVLAALVFWVAFFALVFADPALSDALMNPPS